MMKQKYMFVRGKPCKHRKTVNVLMSQDDTNKMLKYNFKAYTAISEIRSYGDEQYLSKLTYIPETFYRPCKYN